MTLKNKSAVISDCGKYRYLLQRIIVPEVDAHHPSFKKCVFIMLNPSTADAEKDDPTIKRCTSFAKRWGCTEFSVINLYAFRATNPVDMLRLSAIEAKGSDNFEYQFSELSSADLIVAAWGKHGGKKGTPEIGLLVVNNFNLKCLGRNKDGSPKHPLYIKQGKELEDFLI